VLITPHAAFPAPLTAHGLQVRLQNQLNDRTLQLQSTQQDLALTRVEVTALQEQLRLGGWPEGCVMLYISFLGYTYPSFREPVCPSILSCPVRGAGFVVRLARSLSW
jgi:hypothetical protein